MTSLWQFCRCPVQSHPNENKADINLPASFCSFGGNVNFPYVAADFNLEWSFAGEKANSSSNELGSAPVIELNNVTINPGQAIRSLAGPALQQINDIIEPVRPIIEILSTPLPVISTPLAGRAITLVDIAEFFGYVDEGTRKFIDAAIYIVNLIDAADSITESGFVVGSYSLGGAVDVRTQGLNSVNAAGLTDNSRLMNYSTAVEFTFGCTRFC